MTQEQYNRAVEINNRIEALEEVKKEIKGESTHKLSYLYKNDGFNSDFKPCNDWTLRNLGEILDSHDRMIRAEIDEEIEKLKKEIEEL